MLATKVLGVEESKIERLRHLRKCWNYFIRKDTLSRIPLHILFYEIYKMILGTFLKYYIFCIYIIYSLLNEVVELVAISIENQARSGIAGLCK